MEAFGKGNGQAPSFGAAAGARVPKPIFSPTPRATPPPLNRPRPPTPLPTTSAAPSLATHEGARLTDDAYGIRRAIELLRRLPPGERGLLVQVVKLTLESANVRVATIVDDANSREAEIDQRIAVLQREVHEREEEISTRREEIANLEVEQKEISHVRQQLSSVPEQVAPPKVVNARPNDDPTVAEGDDLGRALSVLRTT